MLPFVVTALQLGAAVVYFVGGDWKRAVIWFCYCVVNVMITI